MTTICPVCGSVLMNVGPQSDHAVCPNGHGKLWPKVPEHALRKAAKEVWLKSLPVAVRSESVKRPRYRLDGSDKLWKLVKQKKLKKAEPVEEGQVIASLKKPTALTPHAYVFRVIRERKVKHG